MRLYHCFLRLSHTPPDRSEQPDRHCVFLMFLTHFWPFSYDAFCEVTENSLLTFSSDHRTVSLEMQLLLPKETFIGNKEEKDCYSTNHLKPGWASDTQWLRQSSFQLSHNQQPPLCHLSHTLGGLSPQPPLPSHSPSLCHFWLRCSAGSGRILVPKPGSKMLLLCIHKPL